MRSSTELPLLILDHNPQGLGCLPSSSLASSAGQPQPGLCRGGGWGYQTWLPPEGKGLPQPWLMSWERPPAGSPAHLVVEAEGGLGKEGPGCAGVGVVGPPHSRAAKACPRGPHPDLHPSRHLSAKARWLHVSCRGRPAARWVPDPLDMWLMERGYFFLLGA